MGNQKILKHAKEIEVETPFGRPSSAISVGEIKGIRVAVLARHGKNHSISPTNVNYRANICALRELGATHILAGSACGSLREHIKPAVLVFVDQFIDRTTKRHSTFFDKERVAHIPMAEPFCPSLRVLLEESAKKLGLEFFGKGTVVTIEGPRFSTKAESNLFRQWGADVINMTTVPEVILAREAGLCYQLVAMATDYDCFLEDRPAVTIGEVLKVMAQNAENLSNLFLDAIPRITDQQRDCRCPHDIKTAVL